MPRPRSLKPSYCRDASTDRAYVTIDGHKRYLGAYDSQESRDKYDQLVGEWIARGRPRGLPSRDDGLSVKQLIVAFWAHAEQAYPAPAVAKGKRPAGELGNFWDALRPLLRLYGASPAVEFGPRAMKGLAHHMTEKGLARTTINARLSRIKRVFKWAVNEELLPGEVHWRLLAFKGLSRGRTQAREPDPVGPVADQHVAAVLPHLPPVVRTMVELQLVTGMRSGELCTMRTCDIDTTGTVWTYTPARHKTQHHGHKREVYLGPRAKELLAPYLRPDLQAYLFSPREGDAQRRAELHARRKTRSSCGNKPGSIRRRFCDRYTVAAYRRAIARACDRAFPPPDHLARRSAETRREWLARLAPEHLRREGETHRDWLATLAPEHRRRNAETRHEWLARLTAEQRAELRKWQDDHHWFPHMLRHSAATRWREQFGAEAVGTLLGDKCTRMVDVYAEKNVAAARRAMMQVG